MRPTTSGEPRGCPWEHFSVFMRPLPLAPKFPVYGLPDSVEAFRWLALWQWTDGMTEGDIGEVSLGYGHPDEGPFVRMFTVLKRPRRQSSAVAAAGPIGVEFTASSAVVGMVENSHHFAPPTKAELRDARALFQPEMRRVVESDDGSVELIGWDRIALKIDGDAHVAHVRHIENAWALVVDLPTVVVGAHGPSSMTPQSWDLIDVTARLREYASGNDRGANPPN
jgi:hypothetical protein